MVPVHQKWLSKDDMIYLVYIPEIGITKDALPNIQTWYFKRWCINQADTIRYRVYDIPKEFQKTGLPKDDVSKINHMVASDIADIEVDITTMIHQKYGNTRTVSDSRYRRWTYQQWYMKNMAYLRHDTPKTIPANTISKTIYELLIDYHIKGCCGRSFSWFELQWRRRTAGSAACASTQP